MKSSLPPTAVQVLASLQETPPRQSVVPLDCAVQVAPPSVVRRIVPGFPTAVQGLASVQETARSGLVVPLGWVFHVAPPSVVRTTIPGPPTAVHVLTSVQETPMSEPGTASDVGVWTAQVPPPSVV